MRNICPYPKKMWKIQTSGMFFPSNKGANKKLQKKGKFSRIVSVSEKKITDGNLYSIYTLLSLLYSALISLNERKILYHEDNSHDD